MLKELGLKNLGRVLPDTLRATLMVRALGLAKIPMLFFTGVSVIELTPKRCVVRIPLTRRTRNHLGSMYFGALSVGADVAGGLLAWIAADESGKKLSIVFKDFQAQFLKRPEGDVHFTCEEGDEIRAFVNQVAETGERAHKHVHVVATVPSKLGEEPVAKFVLGLSMKRVR